MRQTYTFDEIALVPQFNNIPSRLVPELGSWLTRTQRMDIPVLASNMDTVIGEQLAETLLSHGTFPIYHRFTNFEKQQQWVNRFRDRTYISCGTQNIDQVSKLLELGALGVCIDIAHGHSDKMVHFVEQLKRTHPDKQIIAGNICTSMAYHDLVNAGADAVKVGIGPGAACITRRVTGFGVPQFSAVQDCAIVAEKLRVPLIADGGIRNSRDIVIALAAGASSVMVGKLFALTKESAANKRTFDDGRMEAKYRGQASLDFQTDFYGALKPDTVAEGIDFWALVSGSAKKLIADLMGGLRSGMTYGGARNIKELQRKAEFIAVGEQAYMNESQSRP